MTYRFEREGKFAVDGPGRTHDYCAELLWFRLESSERTGGERGVAPLGLVISRTTRPVTSSCDLVPSTGSVYAFSIWGSGKVTGSAQSALEACDRVFQSYIMSRSLNILSLPDELISAILENTDYNTLITCRKVRATPYPIFSIHWHSFDQLIIVMPPLKRYHRLIVSPHIYHRTRRNRNVRWHTKRCGTSGAPQEITELSDHLEEFSVVSTRSISLL